MKKYLVLFLALVILCTPAAAVHAISTSINRDVSGAFVEPLIKTDFIKASYFTGTSTTATSLFPNASTTNFSINNWNIGSTTAVVCKNLLECEYTTITSAIAAGWRDIFVKDGTYAEQISITNSKTKLRAQSLNTIIQCNGATQSPCIDAADESLVEGFTFNEANAALAGVVWDASDNALTIFRNNRINNFATSTRFNDTASATFYNRVENNTFAGVKTCYEFSGTQANANWITGNRCQPMAVDGAYGLYAVDARGIYHQGDIEGTTTARSNIGVYMDASSRDNTISGSWIEALGTGVSIASGANNISVIGTTVTSNGADITDNGTNSSFFAVNDTGTKLFQVPYLTLSVGDLTLTGASSDVLSDVDIDFFPNNQTTRAFRFTDNGSQLAFSSTGDTEIAINDHFIGLSDATFDLGISGSRFRNSWVSGTATSSALVVTGLTSALVQTGSDGTAAEYAGTNCTDQFVRGLSVLGAATCGSVGTNDIGAGSNNTVLTTNGSGQVVWSTDVTVTNATSTGSLSIPNSAAPTLGAAGRIAQDTTSNNLIVSTSTTGHYVAASATSTLYGFSVASTSARIASGQFVELPANDLPQVVTAVMCKVVSGTSKVINISDTGTNDSNTATCTTSWAQTAFTSNNSFTANEDIRVEMGATTGTIDEVVIRLVGYRTSN